MKKFKRALSLLMMSAMLILPTALPVQADEIDNNTNEVVTVASTYSFTGYGQINTNGVYLRQGPSTSSTALEWLTINETVHIDYSKSVMSNGAYTWLYVKRSNTGTEGYVAAQYVRVLG